jgi:hypothetical protein
LVLSHNRLVRRLTHRLDPSLAHAVVQSERTRSSSECIRTAPTGYKAQTVAALVRADERLSREFPRVTLRS